MNILSFFRRSSAPLARERLQILLAHERIARSQPDLLGTLREEILAVVSRHVTIDQERVQIKVERRAESSIFQVEIDIPDETLVTASFWAQPSPTQDRSSIH